MELPCNAINFIKVVYTQRQLYVFMALLRVSRLRVSADPQVLNKVVSIQKSEHEVSLRRPAGKSTTETPKQNKVPGGSITAKAATLQYR